MAAAVQEDGGLQECFCCGAPKEPVGMACAACGVTLREPAATPEAAVRDGGVRPESGGTRAQQPLQKEMQSSRRDVRMSDGREHASSHQETGHPALPGLSNEELDNLASECTNARDLEARAHILQSKRRLVQQELIRSLQQAHALHAKLDPAGQDESPTKSFGDTPRLSLAPPVLHVQVESH